MTNVIGFNVVYVFMLVCGGEIMFVGVGKIIVGDINVMYFEWCEENCVCKINRVIERGVSYWVLLINDDDEDDGVSVCY